MGLFKNIAIAVLILSFIIFCALFGQLPRLRKTPIGVVNRLIWVKIPSGLLALDVTVTGGKMSSGLKRIGHYLMHENHPIVMIFYLGVVVCAQLMFVPVAWPRLVGIRRLLIIPMVVIPYYLSYKSVTSTASVITPKTHERHMRQYPYDRVLFHPGRLCRTCNLLKPARSKHCRICNVCVAKADHHCIWVMNCLGRGNYAYFVGMVLSLAIMLTYGAYLAYHLLDKFLTENISPFDTKIASGHRRWSDGKTFTQKFDLWVYAFTEDIRIGAVGLLATFTAPLGWGLFLYHIYLIWAGMTTSESFKWDEWKDDITDGYVFKCTEPKPKPANGEDHEDYDPYVPWPVSSEQRLVSRANRVSLDAEPDAELTKPPWTPVRDLGDVVNIYDLGVWDNFVDIFHTS